MFNKENFSVTGICGADRGYSLTQTGVVFTKGYTAATDGRRLMVVSAPKENIEDFPSKEGIQFSKPKEVIHISRTDAVQIEKLIPKKHPTCPILSHAVIENSISAEQVNFHTTDLSSWKTQTVKKLDTKFPNWVKCIPREKPVIDIRLNLALLNGLIASLLKAGLESAVFNFYDPNKAVEIKGKNENTGQKTWALIMPMQ